MRTVKWNTLLCALVLQPATGIADDSIDKLYESRWSLSHSVDSPTYTHSRPVTNNGLDVDIEDGSSILSVTKIRSLSLFTLAGDEQSKWFLGINEDGFVGVHFRGFTRSSAKRHLDVSALFAKKDDEEDEVH